LFAIRHPEAHARLRTRQRPLRACAGELVRRITDEIGRDLPISSVGAATGLGALSNALLLEHLVDNTIVADKDIRFLLGAFFDAILGTRTAR
jgi:hypothetical protein